MGLTARIYLAAVGLFTFVYFFLPTEAQSGLYNLLGLSAAAAMLIGARWHRLEPQIAWLLLGLGVLALAVGNVVFGESQPVPSLADMFYISGYPLLAMGLAGVAPWRRQGAEPHWVVAAGVTAIVGLVSWAFLILPSGDVSGVTLATQLVALGYPVMDLVLIGLLVRAAAPDGFDEVAFRLLGIGLLLMLIADGVYAVQNFGTDYELGSAVDAAWLLSYAFFGAALLQPRTARRREWSSPLTPGPQVTGVTRSTPTLTVRVAPQALRLGMIATWTGRMLLGLGTFSLFVGLGMRAPNMVFLAGAYGTTGLLMVIASALRS